MRKIKSFLLTACLAVYGQAQAGEMTLHEHPDLLDRTATVRSDQSDLAKSSYDGSKTFRAIRIVSGNWEFCTDRGYRGNCRVYGPGEYRALNGGAGERFLSVREIYGSSAPVVTTSTRNAARIELFPSAQYGGQSYFQTVDNDSLQLGTVRSLIIHSGTWELCTEPGYRGRCQVFQAGQYPSIDGQFPVIRSMRIYGQQQYAQSQYSQPQYTQPQYTQPQYVPAPTLQPSTMEAVLDAVMGQIGVSSGAVPIGGVVPSRVEVLPSNQYYPNSGIYNGRIHFFPGPGFTGSPLTLVNNTPNFINYGFNDRARSIRVESGYWEVCVDVGYNGGCRTLSPGDYPSLYNSWLNRSISSARLIAAPTHGIAIGAQNGVYPPGAPETPHSVMLFSESDFRGETYRSNGDHPRLQDTVMDDRTMSIFIRDGRWEFCYDPNYRGPCFSLNPGSYGIVPNGFERQITSFRRVQ